MESGLDDGRPVPSVGQLHGWSERREARCVREQSWWIIVEVSAPRFNKWAVERRTQHSQCIQCIRAMNCTVEIKQNINKAATGSSRVLFNHLTPAVAIWVAYSYKASCARSG